MFGDILIVDEHEAIRRGLRTLLSSRPEWRICGEATDGIQGVEKAKTLRPAVVLMDISMPRMDGLEATRILRREAPECKIVIISQNASDIARRQSEEVGAAAYVAKHDLARELIPTLDHWYPDEDRVTWENERPYAIFWPNARARPHQRC